MIEDKGKTSIEAQANAFVKELNKAKFFEKTQSLQFDILSKVFFDSNLYAHVLGAANRLIKEQKKQEAIDSVQNLSSVKKMLRDLGRTSRDEQANAVVKELNQDKFFQKYEATQFDILSKVFFDSNLYAHVLEAMNRREIVLSEQAASIPK